MMTEEAQAPDTVPDEVPPGVDAATGEITDEVLDVEAVPVEDEDGLIPQLYNPDKAMDAGFRAPVMALAGIMEARALVEDLIKEVMVPGKHYGVIPGTNRPSLFKPGAELAMQWFGFTMRFPEDRVHRVENVAEEFFLYTYVCVIYDRAGNVVAEAEGACSTREKKYHNPTQKKDRDGNPRQTAFEYVNTVMKMAQKRAFIGAILFACGLSDHFTQDIEDNPEAYLNTDSGPFNLDDEIGFGKHHDKTWRQMCAAAASGEDNYLEWAIGDTGSAGLDKLNADQRTAIRACIAELRGGGGEKGEAPEPQHLLNRVIGGGKHKGKTWAQLVAEERDYVEWAIGRTGDGEGLRKLTAADRETLGEALDNHTADDVPPYGNSWADSWDRLCESDPDVTVEGARAFAKVHPHLPDKESEWTEDQLRTAVLDVEKYGSPSKAFTKALAALAQKEAVGSDRSSPYTADQRSQIKSVPKQALKHGVATEEEVAVFNELVAAGNRERVLEVIETWKTAIFEAVSKGSPGD